MFQALSFLFGLWFFVSCSPLRVEAGDKGLSEDSHHFLLYQGKPLTGILIQKNPILSEFYETEYYKGVPHGRYTAKKENGTLIEERNVRYGQKHGKQISYFENGNLRQKSEFENGKPIGEFFDYFENGQIATYQTFYDSGKPKVSKKWNKRGQIYLNHVFLETGESFGRPGSKLCDPIPEDEKKLP
ncbi:toxin-antitoxin system YwqK family antitoxin [Leptospira meyeri]|uniref:toxin-antitoxin system YwqK family antitoxin n=1 Tax=Leptospira meyeri TaxID=29508 RepID=UPI000C298503|nr:hypothetical protein [Leptospira meyeri]PKA26324.1 hypothetical protein CH381_10905 [Leptospira sp. mixed culture ATI2-C-A1]PJZ79962.1 hypothetical protein CH359_15705 [Leptospira meyeri]PJZ96079.1 hypothetical protein CH358_14200 [Leptospira meyeri]PKA13973.1 hypothetical protein CH372_01335 [Leptospira meyeri]TGL13606.1 hypothetical protein EHQ50_09010 [Leptospira meyeri]